MKTIARIMIACALSAGASLAPAQASAEPALEALSGYWVPSLGAEFGRTFRGVQGAEITAISFGSPLLTMDMWGGGSYRAEVGDVIVAANDRPVLGAISLATTVAAMRGRYVWFNFLDVRTGRNFRAGMWIL